jgi:hypothetical protein
MKIKTRDKREKQNEINFTELHEKIILVLRLTQETKFIITTGIIW